eukprot:GEMP01058733.1.p1 GENE.GEMP01058733.1~~GEMP01058733.1.p1  ORF type:complete len:256 (+),score=31.08 GEMP01058733.1:62-829(+)
MSGRLLLDILILTGDMCLTCSLLSVFNQLKNTKTARSMSLLSLSAIVFARFIHSLSHPLFGLHFMPSELPMLLYHLMDWFNACLGIYVVFFFLKYFSSTYEHEKDDIGSLFLRLFNVDSVGARWALFYGGIAVIALIWNSVRRSHHPFWNLAYFSSYYEVIGFLALMPQLWMFQRDRVVSKCLGNFIVCTALHRACTLSFWLCFPIVYTGRHMDNRTTQISSEILNLLILSDFLYYYVRAQMRGDKDIIIGDSIV